MKPQETTSPRVLIVFGTRPELIKLAPIIRTIEEANARSNFLIVSTAQHTDLLKDQLEFWEISADITLSLVQNQGLTHLLASSLKQMQEVLDAYTSIEYILVQGDTNTALACANLAFLNNKKLLHVEAGLRTHNIQSPFPEEYNRVVASKVAFFHFAPSEQARANLMQEKVPAEKILVTGNTVIDAILLATKKLAAEKASEGGKAEVIITMHRRENSNQFEQLVNIVKKMMARYSHLHFTWVTHPNYSPENLVLLYSLPGLTIKEHLPYSEFIQLYASAKLIMTDSGGVTEEASQLGVPIVVFRSVTDRTEPLEMGHPMVVSLEENIILDFVERSLQLKGSQQNYYGSGNASQLIYNWIDAQLNPKTVHTAIIGGGPAGTGIILKAMKDGSFQDFASGGVALIEASRNLIIGNITQYQVNSDTASDVFLECLAEQTSNYLSLDLLADEVSYIAQFKGKSIPLPALENYLTKLGKLLADYLIRHDDCQLYLQTKATKIIKHNHGTFDIEMSNGRVVHCNNIIIATGGSSVNSLKKGYKFSNQILLDQFQAKSVHSDQLLKQGARLTQLQALPRSPKVVILGGSHSALSAAHFLLEQQGLQFKEESIKVWCRKEPKVFFSTQEEAWEYGYNDFSDEDICPITKRVFRLAGLRMDGRQLYMNMLALGGVEPERRVTLHVYQDQAQQLTQDLTEADLIVHAFGYTFNMLPLANEHNCPIQINETQWVNNQCQMLDGDGNPIEGLYAMGLATGFIPSGELGGEASFTGQTNGFWYYQNATADLIYKNIESKKQAASATSKEKAGNVVMVG